MPKNPLISSKEPLSDQVSCTWQILLKVPEITLIFWLTKLLTTGMGEVFSDFLVTHMNPIIAVALGSVGLAAAVLLQFVIGRYVAWIYWFAVVMVSIFGTMAADIVHVVIGVPYLASTVFFAVFLAVIFFIWFRTEHTLSIHSVFTIRREIFYWVTVMATFALGTATGDMTVSAMHLGYFSSGVLFTVLLVIPALGYWLFGLNEIFAFWFAYIMTRPVGASFSDWISVSPARGGLGFGEGPVSLILTILIILLVGYLTVTGKDIRRETAVSSIK